ncbi:MAG: aminotransferase class IV [Cyanobacteria bacterium P01_F01_bin.153]
MDINGDPNNSDSLTEVINQTHIDSRQTGEPDGTTYWYNGQPVLGDTITLSISDPGLIYGATLFTTLRVHNSLDHPATQWAAHCDRLRNATSQLGFAAPNWDRIRAGADYIQGHYPVVRIVVFPDGTEWITGRSLPADLQDRQTQGITVWVSPPNYQRSLPQYKSSNYLAPWLAARDGRDRNAAETILTNDDGHWLETATGNLWGYGEGQWWIPPLLSDCQTGQRLPGTGQQFLTQLLEDNGQTVTPRPWTPDWVGTLEAIAYSNSGVGLIPIRKVLGTDGTPLWQNSAPSAADKLFKLWQRAITLEIHT